MESIRCISVGIVSISMKKCAEYYDCCGGRLKVLQVFTLEETPSLLSFWIVENCKILSSNYFLTIASISVSYTHLTLPTIYSV